MSRTPIAPFKIAFLNVLGGVYGVLKIRLAKIPIESPIAMIDILVELEGKTAIVRRGKSKLNKKQVGKVFFVNHTSIFGRI